MPAAHALGHTFVLPKVMTRIEYSMPDGAGHSKLHAKPTGIATCPEQPLAGLAGLPLHLLASPASVAARRGKQPRARRIVEALTFSRPKRRDSYLYFPSLSMPEQHQSQTAAQQRDRERERQRKRESSRRGGGESGGQSEGRQRSRQGRGRGCT